MERAEGPGKLKRGFICAGEVVEGSSGRIERLRAREGQGAERRY